MDPRLRMQPGLVRDPSNPLFGRGGGGLQGLSAYSLGLLQSQISSEHARQQDLAHNRAQVNAHALHGAQGLGPSLSTGQGFYTVESLQGATGPRQDGLSGHAHDPSRSLGGGSYGGGGPQGLDGGALNHLYAQQAANQKLVASTPAAGVAPFLYPSHSAPVDPNASAVGRGASNVGTGYGYPPYAQTDASMVAARYAPQASIVSSDAAILLRQREVQLQREREKEREREREIERELERERQREKEHSRARERERQREREREQRHERERDRERERRRERARRDEIVRREINRRREIERRLALDKKRDTDRKREKEKGREARPDKDKRKDRKEKRSSLASPPVDPDKEGNQMAIEKVDKDELKDRDNTNRDNAEKKKVNVKVNSRNIKRKSEKPESKADLSRGPVKDNGSLEENNEEPDNVQTEVVIQSDNVEIEVITTKAEMEENGICFGEKRNGFDVHELQNKVETAEQIGGEKTDEALEHEEHAKGTTPTSHVEAEVVVNPAVKTDQEVSAAVVDEKIDEVKNGNSEDKVPVHQETFSGIPDQSKASESVLGKRSGEVLGASPMSKKTRQPKGKGAGTASTAHPGTVRCEVCKVTCRNAAVYETHLKGEKHAERLKKAQEQAPVNKSAESSQAADQATSN